MVYAVAVIFTAVVGVVWPKKLVELIQALALFDDDPLLRNADRAQSADWPFGIHLDDKPPALGVKVHNFSDFWRETDSENPETASIIQ